MVPSDSIIRKAMYEIRRVDGFHTAIAQDDGSLYIHKNVVKKFPGDPDTVDIIEDQTGGDSDQESIGGENIDKIDERRRLEHRVLPSDHWEKGVTADMKLCIPRPNVSPQQSDWEVLASKNVLPHMLRDGYELEVIRREHPIRRTRTIRRP